ncbi:MAG: hypothetical protein FJY55_08440 [Betaproteobacteria bacterium]|nr:hypothetical protein [Betaproteobacteria bacterium]
MLAQAGAEEGASSEPLDAVVVTGRRAFEDRFRAPTSRVTITRRDIEAIGANSIGDILRQTPGLQVTTTANGGLEIRMRGMGTQNTRILMDGVPVSASNRAAQLPLDELPAELIERIEVIRAPSAEHQGAAGGTLNIVMRGATPRKETFVRLSDQMVWGKHALSLFASQTGPLGDTPARAALPSGNVPRTAGPASRRASPAAPGGDPPALSGASAGREEGPQSLPAPPVGQADLPPPGEAPSLPGRVLDPIWSYFISLNLGERNLGSNTRRETSTNAAATTRSVIEDEVRLDNRFWTLTPRATGVLSANNRVTFRGVISGLDQGGLVLSNASGLSAGASLTSTVRSPWDYERTFFLGAMDWSHSFKDAKWDSTVQLERSRSDYRANRAAVTTLGGVTTTPTSIYDENRAERGLIAKTRLDRWYGEAVWSGGADLEVRRLDVGTLSTIPAAATPRDLAASTRRLAPWTQYELPMEDIKTSVTIGLRAQQLATDISSGGATSRLNTLSWQPSINTRTALTDDTQARFNLARISRTPRVWELAPVSQPNLSTNSPNAPDFQGNPNLRPESIITMDTGLEHRWGSGGQAGANLFFRRLTDVIRQRLFLSGTRWVEQPDNIGDALVWGIETDVRSNLAWTGLSRDWTLTASASLLNSRFINGTGSGQRIPGQARYLANVTIAKPLRGSGGWYGGGTLALVGASELNTPSGPGVAVTGSQRAHAQLDLYIGSVLPRLGFWRLNVNNVTDYRQQRSRVIADNLTGTVNTEHSDRHLTPRVILTIGTRF